MSEDNPTGAYTPFKLDRQFNTDGFWSRPSKSKTGADHDAFIFIGVGHTLTNWEHVELSLSILFGVLVDSGSFAAERAYGTIANNQGKAAALQKAGETFFAMRRIQIDSQDRAKINLLNQDEKVFNALIHNYRSAASRRHEIAHGIVWHLGDTPGDNGSWFLVAPLYQSSKTKSWVEDDAKLRQRTGRSIKTALFGEFSDYYRKNSEYVYGVNDIKVLARKFEHLEAQIIRFVNHLHPGKLPDYTPRSFSPPGLIQ